MRSDSLTLPVLSEPPAPRRGARAEQVLDAVVGRQATAFAQRLEQMLRSKDPEGPHQARVALRRVRTALWAFKDGVRGERAGELKLAAKRVFQEVGRVRDVDVLALEIAPAAAVATPPDALALVLNRLEAERDAARRRFLANGAAAEGAILAIALHQFHARKLWRPEKSCGPEGKRARLVLDGPAKDVAHKSLKKAYKAARQRGDAIATLTIEERHELRKDLKRLRYTAAFFEGLYAKKATEPFLKQLRALQNLFGYLNDVAGGEQSIAMTETARMTNRAAFRDAAERILAYHARAAETAWGQAQKRWRAFAEAPKFW